MQSDEELLDYYYIDYEYLTRVVTYRLHVMKARVAWRFRTLAHR